VGHPVETELRLYVEELALVRGGEDDRHRARRKSAGGALTGGVNELRRESPEREIAPDYAVMVKPGISDAARS
jgi:hypothetical protein